LIAFCANLSAQAVDDFEMHQLRSLKGLNEFGVYVWDIEGYHEDSTLTSSDIEKYVHKVLKNSGIKSVTFSDARELNGAPNLEVAIKVYQKPDRDSYAFSTILRFIQDAKLQRNNAPHYSAIVWERDDLGHADLHNLNLEIKVSLNSMMDEFLADYNKVN
jgi:hypothetical protein